MVQYEVFSYCVKFRHKTSLCSKAAFIVSLITILTVVIPFLVAYRTQGFWLKRDKYYEQPDVHFKYEYFLLVETDRLDTSVVCTTFPMLISSVKGVNSCPIVNVREDDFNRDGVNDALHFEIQALLPSTEIVQSVSLLLIFDYRLYSHSWLEMESLGFLQLDSPLGGSRVESIAELKIHQKQALHNRGRDFRYNNSIIPSDTFDLPSILHNYAHRNVSTRLENIYTTWERGRTLGEPFTLLLTVNYVEDKIVYMPGFWHVIKIAWVQYISLLIPAILVGRQLKHFILNNFLVHNIREIPWKKMN